MPQPVDCGSTICPCSLVFYFVDTCINSTGGLRIATCHSINQCFFLQFDPEVLNFQFLFELFILLFNQYSTQCNARTISSSVQTHQDNVKQNVLLHLLALIGKQPAFHQLRSVEQLGYIALLRQRYGGPLSIIFINMRIYPVFSFLHQMHLEIKCAPAFTQK